MQKYKKMCLQEQHQHFKNHKILFHTNETLFFQFLYKLSKNIVPLSPFLPQKKEFNFSKKEDKV